MTALRTTEIQQELTSEQSFWLALLRSSCETVAAQPASRITATTISRRFPGTSAWERQVLLAMARDVASKAGLIGETEDDGEHITVRFSRPSREEVTENRQVERGIGAIWHRLSNGRSGRVIS